MCRSTPHSNPPTGRKDFPGTLLPGCPVIWLLCLLAAVGKAAEVVIVDDIRAIQHDFYLLSPVGEYQRPRLREPVFDCSDMPVIQVREYRTDCPCSIQHHTPLVTVWIRFEEPEHQFREVVGDFDGLFEPGETIAMTLELFNPGVDALRLMLLVESDSHLQVLNPEFMVDHLGNFKSCVLGELRVKINEIEQDVLNVPLHFVFCNAERLSESRRYLRIDAREDLAADQSAAGCDTTYWYRIERRDATFLPDRTLASGQRTINPNCYIIEPGPDLRELQSRILPYAAGDWMRQLVFQCSDPGTKTILFQDLSLPPGTMLVAYEPGQGLSKGPICAESIRPSSGKDIMTFSGHQLVVEFHAADSLVLEDAGFAITAFMVK